MNCMNKEEMKLENYITGITARLTKSRQQVLKVLDNTALVNEADVVRLQETHRLLEAAESLVHKIGEDDGNHHEAV